MASHPVLSFYETAHSYDVVSDVFGLSFIALAVGAVVLVAWALFVSHGR